MSNYTHMNSHGSSSQSYDCDVVIVGAGVAGLSAAKMLSKHNNELRIKILEARDRVGGRTLTRNFSHEQWSQDHYIDLGGQWVGPTQHYVHSLIREYGLELRRQYHSGHHVLEVDGQKFVYRGNISDLASFATPKDQQQLSKQQQTQQGQQQHVAELDRVWEELDALCHSTIQDVSKPHASSPSRAREFDRMSFAEWTRRNVQSDSVRFLVDWFVKVCFGADPSEISFLYFLTFLKSGGGFIPLVNIDGGAQQDTIIGGSQQLSVRMASDLARNSKCQQVMLNCVVTCIQNNINDKNGVTVHYEQEEGQRKNAQLLRARYCIVAMAPPLYASIRFQPPLPPLKAQLTQRMHMGSIIKVHVVYKRPFWREKGMSGEMISDQGPLSLTYDKCYHDEQQQHVKKIAHDNFYSLVGFIGGAEARYWSTKSKEERKDAVLKQLHRVFETSDAQEPLMYVEHNWMEEPFSNGCYFAVMTPASMCECGTMLREPVGNVHWAGTETASVWIGYIDGAIESGYRAAEEIKQRMSNEKHLHSRM